MSQYDVVVLYIEWSDSTVICGNITISVLLGNTYCMKLSGEDLFRWNWISWFKKMCVLLSLSYWENDVTIANISQSLSLIMTGKQLALIWYEEITSLSPCA